MPCHEANAASEGVMLAIDCMGVEYLSVIRQRYEKGKEPVTRYLDAELARGRSRMNSAVAYYDEKIALSDIVVSMGILSKIWKQ